MKRYAAIPVLINAVLYSIILITIIRQLWHWEPSIPQIDPNLQWIAWLNPFLDELVAVAKWIFGIPIVFAISYFTFVLSCLIIASPFNDILSEKTECIFRKASVSGSSSGSWGIFIRSIFFTLRILARQLFWSLLMIPFLLIPYIGFLPLFIITAYFTGVALVDIPMCRNNWKRKEKESWIKQYRSRIIGIGALAELSFFIPGLALFIFPIGVVAATILYCQEEFMANNRKLP